MVKCGLPKKAHNTMYFRSILQIHTRNNNVYYKSIFLPPSGFGSNAHNPNALLNLRLNQIIRFFFCFCIFALCALVPLKIEFRVLHNMYKSNSIFFIVSVPNSAFTKILVSGIFGHPIKKPTPNMKSTNTIFVCGSTWLFKLWAKALFKLIWLCPTNVACSHVCPSSPMYLGFRIT